jgi:phosphoglucosamine mutase
MVRTSGRSLGDLAHDLPIYPQVTLNVRVRERRAIDDVPELRDAIARATELLDGSGRIIVRYSGTEPLLRVMVEGPEDAQVKRIAQEIAGAATAAVGASDSHAR